jgi:hypothetical protein
VDRATAQAVSRGFTSRETLFDRRSNYVGLVRNKVVLEQIFSEYYGFLCQFNSTDRFKFNHHVTLHSLDNDSIISKITQFKMAMEVPRRIKSIVY